MYPGTTFPQFTYVHGLHLSCGQDEKGHEDIFHCHVVLLPFDVIDKKKFSLSIRTSGGHYSIIVQLVADEKC